MMLVSFIIQAQHNHAPGEKCHFDQELERQIAKDPTLKTRLESNEVKLQKFMRMNPQALLSEEEYVIPVVFHVIHLGEAEGVGNNISDAQILSGLQQLNDGWDNTNGMGVDMNIRFQMATLDPNCNPTNGIVRVDGSSVPNYSTMGISSSGSGADDEAVKDLRIWPVSSYYNIWVVSEINDNDGGAGTQGYATFPGSGSIYDGTVIMNTALGNIGTVNSWNNDGGTLIHELGHALGLWHTFEGTGLDGNGDPVCGTGCGQAQGDCCDDTEPHQSSNSSCPTSSDQNWCTGVNFAGVQYNYMDYSSCVDRFTQDQKDRARSILQTQRPGLLGSNGLSSSPISFTTPAGNCSPPHDPAVVGFIAGITNVSLAGKSFPSSSVGPEEQYIDNASSCINLITVEAGQTYTFTTSVWANSHNVRVWIDFNNDGDFNNTNELVLDESVPGSANPDVNYDYSITIPSSGIVENTTLRMRVGGGIIGTVSDACAALTYGQFEDYPIMIQGAASAAPVADFSLSNFGDICQWESVTLTDLSSNNPTAWNWELTNTTLGTTETSTDQNPTFNSLEPGLYDVSLTASNSAGSSSKVQSSIINTVFNVPFFTSGTSQTMDINDPIISLAAEPVGGIFVGPGITGDIFDPSIAGEGVHVIRYEYTEPTIGCFASTDVTFTVINNTVTSPPTADFSASSTQVCEGETISFTDLSSDSPTSWSWTITGGETFNSTQQNPSFVFNNIGSYEVSLTATNNDGSDTETKTSYITVNALPTPNFTVGATATVDLIDGIQPMASHVSPMGGTFSGPGVTGSDFDPMTAGIGSHTITYTYTDGITGCSGSTTFEYTVVNGSGTPIPPIADFSSNLTEICEGESISFNDLSTNIPTSWSWTMTGTEVLTSSQQNPTVTFSLAGTYEVELTSTNLDGSDTETKVAYITVNALPTPSFTLGSSATVDINDGVQTMTASPAGGTFSGTGVSSNTFDPTAAGTGTHNVTYNYSDPVTGCSGTTTLTYTVTDNSAVPVVPVADFSLSRTSICTGQSVTFSDLSTNNPTSWLWRITGTTTTITSTDQAPTVQFDAAGDYTVELTVTNAAGSDNTSQINVLAVIQSPEISVATYDPSCAGKDDGQISVNVINGLPNNTFAIGLGSQSTGLFTDLEAGNYTITVSNINSCSVSESAQLIEPTAVTGRSTEQICTDETIDFNGTMISEPGSYTETLVTAQGCDSIHTLNVEIIEMPEVSFGNSTGDTVYINETIVDIVGVSPAGGDFVGNGIFNNRFKPAFAGAGLHELVYTYSNPYTGCSTSGVYTILVVDQITSIDGLNNTVSIYPNPTNGIVNIEGDKLSQINVISPIGQLIETVNSSQVDLSRLQQGLYILEIQFTDGSSIIERIIKQ